MSPGAQLPASVLTINVGLSSIKFAFFVAAEKPVRVLSGGVECIGLPGTTLRFLDSDGRSETEEISAGKYAEVTQDLLDWFKARANIESVTVASHRVVHGGPKYHEPQ